MKERRWGLRKRVDFAVSLSSVGGSSQIVAGRGVDLGMGGIGLICKSRVQVGTEWTASFQIPGEPKKFKIACRVARVVPLEGGFEFRVGIQFKADQQAELARIANYLTGTFILV